MQLFIYKTEDGTEAISFYDWVQAHGSEEDTKNHDANNEPGATATPEFEQLLNKYLVEMKIATVTICDEDGTVISGPDPVIVTK